MRQQNGSALTVILVMLVMALLLGLSSVQSSLVDERMAGNYKASTQAYMGAEKAAAEGFQYVDNKANSVIFDQYDIKNLQSAGWGEFKGDKGGLSADDLSGDACQAEQVECYFRFIIDDSQGVQYVAAMGAVVEAGSVIAVSEPVIVVLVPSYAGVSAALSVFGGILDINGEEGKKDSGWYPKSEQARIKGGEFDGGSGSLHSMYYEGVEINTPTLDKINASPVFPDGFDYGGNKGQVGLDSMAFMGELYQMAMGSGNVVTNVSEMNIVKKDATCSTFQFAVVESFSISGGGKFCGVLVFLGDNITLGGTAVVEGLALLANPNKKTVDGNEVFDFSQHSQNVKLAISGGGTSGSVYFNETAVEDAFNLIGEDYLDYLEGGSKSTLYTIGGWGAR